MNVYFALGLQVYNTNNIFLYSEMDKLIAKSRSEIGRVNKPLVNFFIWKKIFRFKAPFFAHTRQLGVNAIKLSYLFTSKPWH